MLYWICPKNHSNHIHLGDVLVKDDTDDNAFVMFVMNNEVEVDLAGVDLILVVVSTNVACCEVNDEVVNEVDAAVEVEFILVAEDVTFDGVDIIVVVVKDTKMEDVDKAEKDGLMLVL